MTMRFDLSKQAATAYEALYAVTRVLEGGALPKPLKHLVDLRVSQINGCSYCIGLHISWALADGERQERLDAVAGWRDSDLFTPDEHVALAWAEALTERHVGQLDALHGDLLRHFSQTEIAELTMMVAVINAWNRVGIAGHRE